MIINQLSEYHTGNKDDAKAINNLENNSKIFLICLLEIKSCKNTNDYCYIDVLQPFYYDNSTTK